MNINMSVIYVTNTGHVIGAITCNSNTSRSLAVADVATPSFLLTQPDNASELRSFSVPASVISVSPPTAYTHDLFLAPTVYAVSGSVVQRLNGDLSTTPPILFAAYLQVNISTAVAADTGVFAQIQTPSPPTPPTETCVITGKISAGLTTANLPLSILPGGSPVSLASGSYSVIVLVAGYKPFVQALSIP
jgi:hypothetical protein